MDINSLTPALLRVGGDSTWRTWSIRLGEGRRGRKLTRAAAERCCSGGADAVPSLAHALAAERGGSIARYHDLLAAERRWRPTRRRALDAAAASGRGLTFGDRPLCTVLRPRFLTPRASTALLPDARAVAAARVPDGARGRARRRRRSAQQFRLTDWEEELVADRPGLPRPEPDRRGSTAFFVDDGRGLQLHRVQRRDAGGRGVRRRARRAVLGAAGDAGVPAAVRGARRSRRAPGVLHALLDALRAVARARASRRASRSSTGARCRRSASSCSSTTTSRAMGIECAHRRPARGRVPRRRSSCAGDCHDHARSTSAC